MKLVRNLQLSLSVLAVASLAACGGGGGGSADRGTLNLALTDAPSCGYDAVNVTIEKVRVHQSESANPDDPSGWSEIVLNPALRVDLLGLQNGALAELGEVTLPAGRYNQMRLVLADNNGTDPLANSVTPTGGSEVALKTPSGQQSGVKAKQFSIDIAANQLAKFVVDFDACKSVVARGGSGQYNLKPQLSVIPRYVSGVAGFVHANMVNGFTSLSLQQDGVVVKATSPDSAGKFMLQPAAPGNYTLVMTAPGRTTAVVTNVVVAAELVTAVNTSATALNPTVSSSATVTGTATPAVETLVPLVRVLQPLSAGPTIEVAGRFVEIGTGSYSFPLVLNAPMVAPYAALPGALVFSPNTAAAGNYTLNASLTGFADNTRVLNPLVADTTVTITPITFAD
jgi:hypothetical protein